ncbi:MAG: calcium/sodium antiporter, partial [Chloroflexi bacterium]|nr:calcium/sodium antiporter [Chloroflexota bacterium]
SNIFNVLFILGVSALMVPLAVSRQLVRLDVPLMMAASVLALVLGSDGLLSRAEGVVLFSGLIAYNLFLFLGSRREAAPKRDEFAQEYGAKGGRSATQWLVNAALVVGGLGALILGSRWLVSSATAIAHRLGVSELIIGLTIVAAGTSLPEVVTSVLASVKGERDIAVGNVVGSNLFNLLGVLGVSAVAAPAGLLVSPAALRFDIPVMIAVAFACLPIFFTGQRIARWEGVLFLAYYVAYTLYLILAAMEHDALGAYSTVMLTFVLPPTALTLALHPAYIFGRHAPHRVGGR